MNLFLEKNNHCCYYRCALSHFSMSFLSFSCCLCLKINQSNHREALFFWKQQFFSSLVLTWRLLVNFMVYFILLSACSPGWKTSRRLWGEFRWRCFRPFSVIFWRVGIIVSDTRSLTSRVSSWLALPWQRSFAWTLEKITSLKNMSWQNTSMFDKHTYIAQ